LPEGLTVFVSSDIPEFQEVRTRLKRVIDGVGFLTPVVFEIEGARPISPAEESIAQAEACDILVEIIGKENSEISKDEFRSARRKHHPCFVYVLDFLNRDPLVERFIAEEVKPHVKYHRFSQPAELYEAVRNDLAHFMGEVLSKGMSQWVREQTKPKKRRPIPTSGGAEGIQAPPAHFLGNLGNPPLAGIRFVKARRHEYVPQTMRILEALASRPMTATKLASVTNTLPSVLLVRVKALLRGGHVKVVRRDKATLYELTAGGEAYLREFYAQPPEFRDEISG